MGDALLYVLRTLVFALHLLCVDVAMAAPLLCICTYIRIYIGGCGWADGEEFAVGDDECPGSPPNADPRITVMLQAGTPYWIELGTWRPDAPWGAPNLPFRFHVTMETCDGDGNGDMMVDIIDFLALLAAWGSQNPTFDLDGDGTVGIADFLALLAAWGPCP